MTVSTPEFRSDLLESDLTITPEAREQLGNLYAQIDDDDIEAVRLYVSGGGCSGMTYGMTFTDRRSEYDLVLSENGFNVYVDIVAMNYLRGVEIDYVSRPTGSSFVFNNVFASTGGSGNVWWLRHGAGLRVPRFRNPGAFALVCCSSRLRLRTGLVPIATRLDR